MLVSYDPLLVALSIALAGAGAYTCFDLVIKINRVENIIDHKKLLSAAAFAIGGGIWSMHFVAMLALRVPITITYDILLTLISGLVSVLMTGLALILLTLRRGRPNRLQFAGLVMGLGISAMHYIGMAAIRGDCRIDYSVGLVVISIFIAIAASTAALRLAVTLQHVWRKIGAAFVMGSAISGMHYTAMAAATFVAEKSSLVVSQPVLSPFILGLVTSIATFVLLGCALLTLVPETSRASVNNPMDAPQADSIPFSAPEVVADKMTDKPPNRGDYIIAKLPVLRDRKTVFLDPDDVLNIQADGHYCSVHTVANELFFCGLALSKVQEQLDSSIFLRVHRSHIINLRHVESFERQHDAGIIILRGEDHTRIPVSRKKILVLREMLGI